MRSQRGARGRFSSLYGTTTLRLGDDFPVPPGAPRYERLVFDCDGQLIVALNEWYRLMHGVGAARTRETYLAVLRPWCGFLGKHGYAWNARPEAVREYTRWFLVEAGCALQRGKGEHTIGKPIWCSAETRDQLRRYVARERSKADLHGRTRVEDLEDDDAIFLSNRRRQLGYSGFRIVFNRVLGKAQRHFGSGPNGQQAVPIALPTITPHTIRHLHTTFRVKKVRELFSTPAERERALEALVDDLGWRSAEMLKTYDHAITRAELKELLASSVRQMLQDAPYDAASLRALIRKGIQSESSVAPNAAVDSAPFLSDEARQALAWIDALAER